MEFSASVSPQGLRDANKNIRFGLLGGSVVKSPPANAGDMGLIPGLGRSHMQRSNLAPVPQLLSLCLRAHALQQEKPPQ